MKDINFFLPSAFSHLRCHCVNSSVVYLAPAMQIDLLPWIISTSPSASPDEHTAVIPRVIAAQGKCRHRLQYHGSDADYLHCVKQEEPTQILGEPILATHSSLSSGRPQLPLADKTFTLSAHTVTDALGRRHPLDILSLRPPEDADRPSGLDVRVCRVFAYSWDAYAALLPAAGKDPPIRGVCGVPSAGKDLFVQEQLYLALPGAGGIRPVHLLLADPNYRRDNLVIVTSKIIVSKNKFSYTKAGGRSQYTAAERFAQTLQVRSPLTQLRQVSAVC